MPGIIYFVVITKQQYIFLLIFLVNSPLNVGEKSDSGNKDLNPPKTDSISPYAVPGVSLPTLKESDHDDAGETGHAIADSTTNSPTTLPRGKLTPVLDIFIAAMKAALDEDEGDEPNHVIDDSPKDVTSVNGPLNVDEKSDSGNKDLNSPKTESISPYDMSTEVLTAGCLPQCQEPRPECVNFESVMPSEQVSHLPTSINEDDTNIAGNDGFPQFQNKVEGNLNKFNGIIGRSKLRTPSISISYLSLY